MSVKFIIYLKVTVLFIEICHAICNYISENIRSKQIVMGQNKECKRNFSYEVAIIWIMSVSNLDRTSWIILIF
jgi:hypothetical protein